MSDVVDLFDQAQQQVEDMQERKAAGIPPIPKRPLTAYNIFSTLERHYILQQHDKTVDPSEAVDTPDKTDGNIQHEDPYVSNRPARYKDVILPPNWYVVGMNRKKRNEHKRHGVISFKALSKMISDAWNTSPDETKAYCKMISKEELRKYYEEQKIFKKKYGEEAFEAQTRKRKNAEAVEAGLTQGRKCHKKQREKAAAAAAAKAKSSSEEPREVKSDSELEIDEGAAKKSDTGLKSDVESRGSQGAQPELTKEAGPGSPKQPTQGSQDGLMGLMGGAHAHLTRGSQEEQPRLLGGPLSSSLVQEIQASQSVESISYSSLGLQNRDSQGFQSHLMGEALSSSLMPNIQRSQHGLMGLMGGASHHNLSGFEGRGLQGLPSHLLGDPLLGLSEQYNQRSQLGLVGLLGDIDARALHNRSLDGALSSLIGRGYAPSGFQYRELLELRSRLLERDLIERALAERALRERALAQHLYAGGPSLAISERALAQHPLAGAPSSATASGSLHPAQESIPEARAASAEAERALAQRLLVGAPSSAAITSGSLRAAHASIPEARATGGTQPILTRAALAQNLFPDVANLAPSSAFVTAPNAAPVARAGSAVNESHPEPRTPPPNTNPNNVATAANGDLDDGEKSALVGLLKMGVNWGKK